MAAGTTVEFPRNIHVAAAASPRQSNQAGLRTGHATGDHNKLKGGIGHDMLRVRGTWNIVEGGPDDDDIGAEGNQNMLYGEDGDDTLFVPTMGGSLNILDGGPHVATDTCGADCMANTCVDCFP